MFCLKRCKYLSSSACLKPLLLKTNGKDFLRCLHSEQRDINTSNLWIEPTGYNTGIKIYNPILKENVDLILRTNNVATWYSCGPTVYDSAHIGHASCYVKFDIIRRILEKWFDINTILLMGITDVDDKIIKRANEVGIDYACISRKYELEFFRDLDNLNVLRPAVKARVTEHIPKILDFINKIIAEGHAYIVPSGSVYFQTSKFERYNKFGMAASVDSNESSLHDGKISPSDFALWKAAKPGEPFWDSPWGAGRPGWHIECSAIASTVFGRSIDIHSGGIDLKFPHHENEEAQSCSHHCVDQWVNYWIYSGHLNVKGDEKMSKSLKNTLLIEDFLKQYSANEFRTLCLMSHYRSGLEYSEDAVKTASSIYKRIESFLHTCDAYLKGQFSRGYVDKDTLLKELEETRNDLHLCFTDDFNTPKALSSLMELISKVNWMFNEESEEEGVVRSLVAVAAVSNFVKESCTKLGFNIVSADMVSNAENIQLLTNVLDTAVEFRSRVREIIQSKGKTVSQDVKAEKQGLYKCCDEFRDHLINLGIQLEDHGEKSSWKLKNNVIQDENSYKR